MKSSIKIKFTIGLSIILIITGIILNLLIIQVFTTNLENTIKKSMNDIMISSREYVDYKLIYKNLPFTPAGLKFESGDISDYFTSTYGCASQVFNMGGGKIEDSNDFESNNIKNINVQTAMEGKAVINIKYSENQVNGILSFPLCYYGKYIGIIAVNKSFGELYKSNNSAIKIITAIEFVVFIIIFILSFIFISYIIKPLKNLTSGLKNVGDGNYETNIRVKNKDEIGELSTEFMNMKLKIKKQLEIINLEKEKVLELESSRQKFFNNVTHELKTPLTAISGYAQMLQSEGVEDMEFKKRAVQRIFLESERMNTLVLDLIRVSMGTTFIKEEKKPINMYKLLNEICDDMDIKAKKYFLNISRDIKAGWISGQNNKIRQLVINILDNAIKYSFKDGQILIKTFILEGFYVIQVTNRGEKISQKVHKNIFEPLVRGIKNGENSSGLGLYICNEIVKEHDGEITVENGEVIKVIVKIPSFRNNLETI